MKIEWKIQIALLALWFTLVVGATSIDNVKAQHPGRQYGGARPIEWDSPLREPTTHEMATAIRDLENEVKKLERRVTNLE